MLPLIMVVLALAAAQGQETSSGPSIFDTGGKLAPRAIPGEVPPDPGSRWIPVDPAGSAADNNVSASDKIGFWTDLQNGSFDGLCRQAQIPLSGSLRLWSAVEPGGAGMRYFRVLPDGGLAIIDEDRISALLGWLPRWGIDSHALHATLDLTFGARIRGTSMVVRRLEVKQSCEAVKRLANLKDVKTVVPLTAARISTMAMGEIWRIPLTVQIGVGGSFGDPVRFPLTVSLGANKEGDITATLRRLDPKTLRFRVRFETARLLDVNGKVAADIPILMFGLPGAANALLRGISTAFFSSLDEFLAVQLELERHRRDGTQAEFEFLLDPGDAQAMDRLTRVLRGDLAALGLLKAVAAGHPGSSPVEDPWERIGDPLQRDEAGLGGPASFAGTDKYEQNRNRIHAMIPFAFEWERTKLAQADRVDLKRGTSGQYELYRSERKNRRAFADVPFFGQLFTRQSQRDADIAVQRGSTVTAQGPALVYVQQEGFLRQDREDSRRIVQRAGDLMGLVGAHGRGEDPSTALPVDRLVTSTGSNNPLTRWRDYRLGVSALTVVLGTPALAQILSASPRELLAAYANSLEGAKRAAAEWLSAHASFSPSGLVFEREAAEAGAKALSAAGDGASVFLLHDMREAADAVSKLARDLVAAKMAPTPEAKAQALRDLMSGSAGRALAYDGLLRVLVQLVAPADVSAEYVLDLTQGRNAGETRVRYVMNPDLQDKGLLEAATQARARFQQTSPLTD